jgi:hypothetical protein
LVNGVRSGLCRNGQDHGFERDCKEDRTAARIHSEDGEAAGRFDQGTEKGKMNRLQKFIEQGAYGEKSGRVAYVLRLDTLPDAIEGMTWQNVQPFSAADDLLENASLRDVFKAAIANGCAVNPGAD